MKVNTSELVIEGHPTIVLVEWLDAFDGDGGWTQIADYCPEPAIVIDIGFLWPDFMKDYLTLFSGYGINDLPGLQTVSGPKHIPLAMVRKIQVIDRNTFDPLSGLEGVKNDYTHLDGASRL